MTGTVLLTECELQGGTHTDETEIILCASTDASVYRSDLFLWEFQILPQLLLHKKRRERPGVIFRTSFQGRFLSSMKLSTSFVIQLHLSVSAKNSNSNQTDHNKKTIQQEKSIYKNYFL